VGERRVGDPPLPAELEDALREWGALAHSMARYGIEERELLQHRGRRLAARVAEVLGRPVEYTDPVTGHVEAVDAVVTDPIPRLAADPAGPTPWATGLAVSGFFAVFVAVGDLALSRAFAEAFGLLWVPANLLVGIGLAPSLLLLRRLPFWRWPAFGTAAGLLAAWVVLLLELLA
jgi:Protein of unknown function (DUF2537)